MAESYSRLANTLDRQALVQEPSALASYAVDGWQPALALLPASPEEAALALRRAAEGELGVVPWGSGSKQHWGTAARQAQIVLCSRRLCHVLDYDPDNLTVGVQAGITLSSLQEMLRPQGLFLPLDPPYADRATLGGILAANSSGPRRLLYSGPRDLVLGLRAALPDGRLVKFGGKTVKNVAGYDLAKLFVGSLGTLGLIVEATLKLRPRPEDERTLVLSFHSLEGARGAVGRVMGSSQFMPAALELMNAEAAQVVAGWAGLGPAQGPLLAVALEGFAEEVEAQARGLSALAPAEALKDGPGLWKRLAAGIPGGVTARAGVPAGLATAFMEAAGRMAAELGVGCPILAGAGTGIVRFYPSGQGEERQGVEEFLQGARALATGIGGYLVLEEAPLQLKTSLGVWGDPGPALSTFQRIKAVFDPRGVLNPGRFLGGL